jgi:hypothetical protein
MDIDSPQPAPFIQGKSDEETNKLDLRKPNESLLNYLIRHLEKVVDVTKLPNGAAFHDNCLEYRLDRRTTSYNFDDVDNVNLLLAVSGAGKTRTLLELLYSNFGYYFTSKSSHGDFGSGDLALCQAYCDRFPLTEDVERVIQLLYFVRAAVCNYLMEKGFKKPWDLLLAQLHPVSFFGIDIFKHLFNILLKEPYYVVQPKIEYFSLVAIDEIQIFVESNSVHSLTGSRNLRPFFSPLVYYSKMMQTFPQFLLSGTGMNFDLVKDSMEACVMLRVVK